MTTTNDDPHDTDQPGPARDPVTVLFAAALAGDRAAEDALREAALISDRAADALFAFACPDGGTGPVDGDPADLDPTGEAGRVAAADQMLAFLRPHLAAARAEHLTTRGRIDGT